MKESLTPEKIFVDLSLGEINKEEAVDLLISLIEKSDKAKIRANSINILEKVSDINEKFFQVLENCLLSDENAYVRASAVKSIIMDFGEAGIAPIKWSLEHDKSPLVLKIIFDYFENYENSQFKTIKDKISDWFKVFSSEIGISSEESRFFFDLEFIFAKNKRNYEINPKSYKTFKGMRNSKESEPWLVINNKHVEILNFNFFNWNFIKEHPEIVDSLSKLQYLDLYFNAINRYNYNESIIFELPESIGKLKFLKKLILKRNNLKNLPKSIEELIFIRELDLSHNKLEEIPNFLKLMKSIKKLNLKHNEINKNLNNQIKFLNSLDFFEY
jgi:Leucine-rich repeat (LRR) protein